MKRTEETRVLIAMEVGLEELAREIKAAQETNRKAVLRAASQLRKIRESGDRPSIPRAADIVAGFRIHYMVQMEDALNKLRMRVFRAFPLASVESIEANLLMDEVIEAWKARERAALAAFRDLAHPGMEDIAEAAALEAAGGK